ncbi:MAG: protein kinase [Pyrinomonadaceae bacterium]|nr:protein kinase [Pyrinomonadaceae bacterium]
MIGSKIHHYEILKKLGAGGQGTVYKARDTKLDRDVVIKVLPPELTSRTANFKRFEREAKLCSQLDHPNICTIYDYHEDDGTFYIAMQYVHGKNVRQLVDGRPLELKSAVNIAIQVCDALAYAHSRNIIHRDIKAGNVMVDSEGKVKILDFGLAKLMQDEIPADAKEIDRTDLTELGIPYGTATYAAPEQAKGEATDHRADIFSTGVLVYELLCGIWAFQGKTVVDVRHQVLHGIPTPIAEMRADAFPPKLQEIVDKALQKNPNDRYQKIDTMRDELRMVMQEITGVPMVQADAYKPVHLESANPVKKAWNWLTGKSSVDVSVSPTGSVSATQTTPTYSPDTTYTAGGKEKKSVAILPFKNMNRDPESDFYEFALADAVITELARLKSLIVRPSSVIAKYQGREIDEREVGRELKVHAVLTAGFIKGSGRMRVTAQLLDVITGEILWGDRIDAEGEDILALQDVIALQILEGLRLELTDKEQETLNRRPTENAAAYEQYLRGRDSFGRFIFRTVSNKDCEEAIADFKTALELDPEFALAYSGLGACYANRIFKGMGEAADYELAEEAFNKAIEYDERVSEARVLMVLVYMAKGEKAKAREEIQKLETLFPNEAPLYFVKGTVHRLDGEYDEALKSFAKLTRLDPAAVVVSSYNRARIFNYKGEYEKALQELDRGAKVEKKHPMIRIFRSASFYYMGRNDEAIDLMKQVLSENDQMEGIRPLYALILAGSGKKEEARRQLSAEALSISKADHDMAYWVGVAYANLGETDRSFKWLNRAVSLGNENKPLYESDPNLASIRDDERFEQLLARM